MFIKTPNGALINSKYIRVIFIEDSCKRVTLNAELDNGDQYILATSNNPEDISSSMEDILAQVNKEAVNS